jgi:hypothetical protein
MTFTEFGKMVRATAVRTTGLQPRIVYVIAAGRWTNSACGSHAAASDSHMREFEMHAGGCDAAKAVVKTASSLSPPPTTTSMFLIVVCLMAIGMTRTAALIYINVIPKPKDGVAVPGMLGTRAGNPSTWGLGCARPKSWEPDRIGSQQASEPTEAAIGRLIWHCCKNGCAAADRKTCSMGPGGCRLSSGIWHRRARGGWVPIRTPMPDCCSKRRD